MSGSVVRQIVCKFPNETINLIIKCYRTHSSADGKKKFIIVNVIFGLVLHILSVI